jgi:two-component system OmpR family response regulator
MSSADGPLLLVADDDEDILAFLVPSLHAAGYRVLEAHNGVDALRLAMATQVDLALLDIGMPGLDGKAVLRVLSAKGDVAPPVIFVTARAMPNEAVEGRRLGAVDYITKPFEIPELIKRVSIALVQHGRRTAAA